MEFHIIFLSDKYFNTSRSGCLCAKKYRDHLVNDLENKGINVKKKSSITELKKTQPNSSFNDEPMPKLNVLYMRLLNEYYYSDDLFAKRKAEVEREILFLLAGKLGVCTIEYTTEIAETTLSKTQASVNLYNVNSGATYSKEVKVSNGQTGKEVYLNRGAPVYCLSKTLNQVEENIKRRFNKLNCKLFSYGFYKNNPKLQSFVYKRFNFKMGEVEYTSEMANNMDMSFDVKATLMDYGIGIKFEKHTSTSEKITYKLNFFNDRDLRLQLHNIIRLADDPFESIREIYESEDNKEISVYHITEYVRKYSKKITFAYTDTEGKLLKNNYKKRLIKWISDNGMKSFEDVCHSFTSSYQIKTWLRSTLKYDTDSEMEEEDDEDDIENYGILKLQNTNYKMYKNNLSDPCNKSSQYNKNLQYNKILQCDNNSDDEYCAKITENDENDDNIVFNQNYRNDSFDSISVYACTGINSGNNNDDDDDDDDEYACTGADSDHYDYACHKEINIAKTIDSPPDYISVSEQNIDYESTSTLCINSEGSKCSDTDEDDDAYADEF